MKTLFRDTGSQNGWYIELAPLVIDIKSMNTQHVCRPEYLGPWDEVPVILGSWVENEVGHTLILAPEGSDFTSYHITNTNGKEEYFTSLLMGRPSNLANYALENGKWVKPTSTEKRKNYFWNRIRRERIT